MTRNSKALLLAVLALLTTAAVASVAQATAGNAQFTSENKTFTLDGTEEDPDGTMVRDSRTFTCTHVHYTGTGTHGASAVTVQPTEYTHCTNQLNGPITITMNGCAFVFEATADASDTFTGVTDLECEGPIKKVETHTYSTTHNHATGIVQCTYELTAANNQNLTGIELTNIAPHGSTPKDYITADIDIQNQINSKRVAGSAVVCGTETDHVGDLTAKVKFKGTDGDGSDVGITVSTK